MTKTLLLANQIASRFGTAFVLTPNGYAAKTQYSPELLGRALTRQNLSVLIDVEAHRVYLCA